MHAVSSLLSFCVKLFAVILGLFVKLNWPLRHIRNCETLVTPNSVAGGTVGKSWAIKEQNSR